MAVVSVGSLCDGAGVGIWCYTTRSDERTQSHGMVMAQWLKGLSQAARHLQGNDSNTVMAAQLWVHPQSVNSLDAARLPIMDAGDVYPPGLIVLPTLTNLPPPSA